MRVLRDRPVAIVLPGPSISALKSYIDDLAPLNICWGGTNKFWVIEERILQPAGVEIEILWHGCSHTEPDQVKEYLARETDNILAAPCHGMTSLGSIGVELTSKKIVHFNCGHANSLSIFLILLRFLKVKKVFLFGADGKPLAGQIHYGQEILEDKEKFVWYEAEEAINNIVVDTAMINKNFQGYCQEAGCGKFPIDIVNVTEDSALTVFRKIPYPSAVEELKALEV